MIQVVDNVSTIIDRYFFKLFKWITEITKQRLHNTLWDFALCVISSHWCKTYLFQSMQSIFNGFLQFEHFRQKRLIKCWTKCKISGNSFMCELRKFGTNLFNICRRFVKIILIQILAKIKIFQLFSCEERFIWTLNVWIDLF